MPETRSFVLHEQKIWLPKNYEGSDNTDQVYTCIIR